jgi:serine/threonine kinase 32
VEELSTQDESIGKHNFTFIYVVGKGGFGKVWKVEYKKTRKSFAMKEMSKSKYPYPLNVKGHS